MPQGLAAPLLLLILQGGKSPPMTAGAMGPCDGLPQKLNRGPHGVVGSRSWLQATDRQSTAPVYCLPKLNALID